jgi:hypothetical protein
VVITLLDGAQLSNDYSMTATVTNSAPVFDATLIDQTVNLNQNLKYQLPAITDSEGNTISVTLTSAPTFITLSGTVVTINPTSNSDIGSQVVGLQLSDSVLTTAYQFTVTVAGAAPVFVTSLIN